MGRAIPMHLSPCVNYTPWNPKSSCSSFVVPGLPTWAVIAPEIDLISTPRHYIGWCAAFKMVLAPSWLLFCYCFIGSSIRTSDFRREKRDSAKRAVVISTSNILGIREVEQNIKLVSFIIKKIIGSGLQAFLIFWMYSMFK